MNLLEIYENSKQEDEKYKQEKKNYELKKELRKLMSEIVKGTEEFGTNNKDLIKELDIKKFKKRDNCSSIYYSPFSTSYEYSFKINKTNIQKVQKYIDKTKKEGK